MVYIIVFFIAHWWLSLFTQSIFYHKYGTHHAFTMSRGWEKFFMVFSGIAQGSSYLKPWVYVVLHGKHHAYTDTVHDPHSPQYDGTVFRMMWNTKRIYSSIEAKETSGKSFDIGPHWKPVEDFFNNWAIRVAFGVLYTLFYIHFVPNEGYYWLLYCLLPIHYLMGPVHGAIVNWFGHTLGYRNWNTNDASRNFVLYCIGDWIMLGEAYHNNHHQRPHKANFADKWWEFDPGYFLIKLMAYANIVQLP
jgi:stearoyl-CoA desaturase (Delta-9 desaturase)